MLGSITFERQRRATILMVAAVAAMGTIAMAGPAAAGASMTPGGLTSQPIGHYDFCRRLPAECTVRPRDQRIVRLDQAVWRTVDSINRAVNDEIQPKSDMEIYGQEEFWAYPTHGVGDCEDYVLEKRRRLAAAGISLSNLLITVVRKPDGEGHAVLTLRTDQGDFILDNLKDDVRPWHATQYRFLKRQARDHAGRWVSLHEEPSMLVGSVR